MSSSSGSPRSSGRGSATNELLGGETKRRIAGFDGKVDRVLGELERSVGRLTADRELLAGIRAFVRVIEQS